MNRAVHIYLFTFHSMRHREATRCAFGAMDAAMTVRSACGEGTRELVATATAAAIIQLAIVAQAARHEIRDEAA